MEQMVLALVVAHVFGQPGGVSTRLSSVCFHVCGHGAVGPCSSRLDGRPRFVCVCKVPKVLDVCVCVCAVLVFLPARLASSALAIRRWRPPFNYMKPVWLAALSGANWFQTRYRLGEMEKSVPPLRNFSSCPGPNGFGAHTGISSEVFSAWRRGCDGGPTI